MNAVNVYNHGHLNARPNNEHQLSLLIASGSIGIGTHAGHRDPYLPSQSGGRHWYAVNFDDHDSSCEEMRETLRRR
jgi:hypothetical protein